jgi:hypothetical protein
MAWRGVVAGMSLPATVRVDFGMIYALLSRRNGDMNGTEIQIINLDSISSRLCICVSRVACWVFVRVLGGWSLRLRVVLWLPT